MRVIAGHFKGRKLKAVPGKETRPTSDKVKEAVFQMIGPFFDGGHCLDLFSGSGALGIEAVSRGMTHAVFVDKQGQAIKTIETNIKALDIENQTETLRMDALRSLRILGKNNAGFNLIMIDPPYELTHYDKLLAEIIKCELINENGLIICEHDSSVEIKDIHSCLEVMKQVKYGTTSITIYRYIKGGLDHESVGNLSR